MTNVQTTCPVCRASSAEFWGDGYDRLFGLTPGIFRLFRCSSCRCVFQAPMPAKEDIPAFYPEGYWWSEAAAARKGLARVFSRLEQSYREFVAADHVRFVERCAGNAPAGERALLDIGCGSGLFLYLAKRRGFDCHGMDASERAACAAREQYGLDVRRGIIGADVWGGRRFDFVTMFHVLEHLIEPREALAYASGLLKPGGNLIVQVPNIESIQARCFGSRWYGLDVPRHLVNFTPAALEGLLKDSGFKIVRKARFSLRDNPPSIASSLAPRLDPIGRSGRGIKSAASTKVMMDVAYFALVLFCLPAAFLESALGLGGTIWVQAKMNDLR